MAYKTATESNYRDNAGTVTARSTSTIVIDVNVDPSSITNYADEYVIRVNGRPVKRLTNSEARRFLGLTNEQER